MFRVTPLLPLIVILATGCGGSSRCNVKGAITWRGQPVPAGEVIFEPDPTKGNVGPQVIASIKDGRFATLPGNGSVTGPVTVIVRGFDGKPTDNPLGRPLFPPYTLQLELAPGRSELDIPVPDHLKYN